jgi:hypothetical protein
MRRPRDTLRTGGAGAVDQAMGQLHDARPRAPAVSIRRPRDVHGPRQSHTRLTMLHLATRTSAARLAAAAFLAAAPGAAQTDAITGSFAGNQTFAGTLSQEFTVAGTPVRVTRLGAFDDDRQGFAESITVRLYDVATGTQVGQSLTFTGLVGSATGSFRFLDLATPIDLPTGFVGRIAASGYGGAERYYNAFFNNEASVSMNGGGTLSFGRVYYANDTGFPDQPSGDVRAGWYGAGSFTFGAAASTVPEPATWTMLGGALAVLAGVSAVRRRRG